MRDTRTTSAACWSISAAKETMFIRCSKPAMLQYILLLGMLSPSLLQAREGITAERVKYPFQDPTLPWGERVDDLVSRLTLEEVVNQTVAHYLSPGGSHTSAIPRLGIHPYVWGSECMRGQQKTNTTAFPQSIGLSSSFSGALMYDMMVAISYEVRAHWNDYRSHGLYLPGNGLSCLSPVINIMRHPLWGRNQETYGEDPFLSGSLVQNYVRGLQGNHPRYIRANAGCKHFDVHGGPEDIPTSRFSFNSKVSMRDWRMTFLPQFKMCVEAGTYNLMCSYNSINGVPACANKQLMTDIARKEWGFTGFIISDAGAIPRIITGHKYLHSKVDAAAAAIRAGCNLELSSGVYFSQLEAVKQGKLTEQEVRDNVKPLFYTRMRLGEFDPEVMNPYNMIDMSVVQSAAHRDLARRAAQMSFVLLKNENSVLPLAKQLGRIAIVGPFANTTDELFGDYTSNILPRFTTTVFQGLQRLGRSVKMASGCSHPACTDYEPGDVKAAIGEGVDAVIVALGTGSLEHEGHDRSNVDLAGSQLQIVKDAVFWARGRPVILLLFNAGPLDVIWAKLNPGVAAILACFFPAQATGEALYNILTRTGPDSVPAGRLSATWPDNINQVSGITNYTMAGRTYRYYSGDPLYPFGYGLSYTTFHYTSLTVSPQKIAAGNSVMVTVGVKNIGLYDADEVVQVYMSWGNSSVPLPKLQLVGFTREHLKAGEHRVFDFTIKAEQMAVWIDDNKGWGYLSGKVSVYAGGQQPGQRTLLPSNVLTTFYTMTE